MFYLHAEQPYAINTHCAKQDCKCKCNAELMATEAPTQPSQGRRSSVGGARAFRRLAWLRRTDLSISPASLALSL